METGQTRPVDVTDVEAAAHRISGDVRTTPVLRLEPGAVHDRPVVLKLEQLQVTGTFKARGAFNLIRSRAIPAAGVVAASGGNFGLALAHAATSLGRRATVFVPEVAPPAKVERLRAVGADVRVVPGQYPAALAASEDFVATTGALRGHAYDLPEVVAGAGTVAREFERQADLDVLVVAVGGGGLIGGIASWFRGRVRVVGVETVGTPTMHAALASGRPVDVEPGGLAASSLGAGRVGALAWAARDWIDDVVLVGDEDVASAQAALWDTCRVVAEPGGAAALAGLRSGAVTVGPRDRIGVLVCGANTDPGAVT